MIKNKKRVCPVERSHGLDNIFRKLIHNPRKILGNYIKEGMTILDIGCGPGFFSIEIAKMVGNSGKVIAADLQKGMLDKLESKIKGKEIGKRIKLHKCTENRIGVSEKVDFALAFYVVHEIPNQESFMTEVKSILKPNGLFFIIEPSFHVSKQEFKDCIKKATELGFKPIKMPKVLFSRAIVLEND